MRIGTRDIVMAAAALALAALGASDAAAGWRPRLGLEAGPGLTRMPGSALLGEEEHWAAGGTAGVVAEWPLVPGWSLAFAPRWERLVGRTSGAFEFPIIGGTARIAFDQDIAFDRVGLPLRVAFRPGPGRWALEAGAHAAWLAHAGRDLDMSPDALPFAVRAARPAAAIFEEVGTFDADDVTHLFHRWDLAAVAGVGWDRPLGGALGGPVLRLRARAQQGLIDISKYGDDPLRLTSAELTVGLLW